ncbi:MAG TPA: hypothetical protein VHY22_16555 [Chthoniobacteraceae bacterium]|nr:hypothetical protein [Chthoniobacteraceae bacterium]
MAKEVEIAMSIIEEWNRLHSETAGCTIRCRHWKTDTFPNATKSGQGAINEQIIDNAEIIVAIFWSRIGTPTSNAMSGTVEEIGRGIERGRYVLVYFSDIEPVPANADPAQLQRLWDFRQELREKSSCWTFRSRNQFRDTFRDHLTLALNLHRSQWAQTSRRSRKASVRQTSSGNGNTQIAGDGNSVENHYHNARPPKKVIERRADSVTREEERKLAKWIKELAEGTVGKSRDEAYGEWGAHFTNHFDIETRAEFPSAKMAEAEDWYRLQRNLQLEGYRTAAADKWRAARTKAIKAGMKAMGRTNEDYYPELSDRLNMKRPFTSLTKLTKADLDRVYNMVRRDSKKREN